MVNNFQELGFSKPHLDLPRTGGWPFIKDPIHGEITFEGHSFWLYSLLNTPEFQRLSGISQLGFLHENFPGATHTRLSHSLGVYALTSKFINHFLSLGDLTIERDQLEIDLCLASALLHDLGHGPFSHLFEFLVPAFNHEDMTRSLILNKSSKLYSLLAERSKVHNQEEEFLPSEITKILSKSSSRKWIEELISSDIDVDRLDYLLRDKYFCGSFTLSIDPNLIIKWTRLLDFQGQKKLAFLEKTNYQRYSLLLSREYMQKEVYSNVSACSYQIILCSIFEEWKRIFESRFLSKSFYRPLYPVFFVNPSKWELSDFLRLNDCSILSRLEELFLELQEDKEGSELLYSLLLLFKGYGQESNHRLLRISYSDSDRWFKFLSSACSDLEREEEIIQMKAISALSGQKDVGRSAQLTYLDWSTKSFQQLELSLPKPQKKDIQFVLLSKKLATRWDEFRSS
ncbi:metal-dependent phosphohydrolase [Candidatus Mycoplasma haematolamae str. Purdue]|uniref:Metal-dependent phosphohydrolase n=1 Tax=Mycoplasma haematolamae (strain Purdue) TaxID=1212765 RepID=I7BIN3_MYCHA|nr:HD domain-containing protein [Candidatus Mycoplasma haematolamae]AFO51683.1 metal-dependent phosphohydrolase [Candidatus Mycoplasma haematolamae str. Purdue]